MLIGRMLLEEPLEDWIVIVLSEQVIFAMLVHYR